MTSSRPYLIRALHEWIVDNGLTPHLLINAEYESVVVPTEFVQDGRIVMNVSMQAVRGLRLGNDAIEFEARFGGRPMGVYLPVPSVLAIYARENGQGMMFTGEDGGPAPDDDPGPGDGGPRRPALRVVK